LYSISLLMLYPFLWRSIPVARSNAYRPGTHP